MFEFGPSGSVCLCASSARAVLFVCVGVNGGGQTRKQGEKRGEERREERRGRQSERGFMRRHEDSDSVSCHVTLFLPRTKSLTHENTAACINA